MQKSLLALILAVSPAAVFSQQSTIELPPQQVSPSSGDGQWHPSDAQTRRLAKQTYAYFAARDGHRFVDAYAYFSVSQKQAVPFDGWKHQLETFYRRAGRVEARRIKK